MPALSPSPDDRTDALVRDASTRAAGAVGLGGIALIHLLDGIGKYSETRYIFWMYVALMVASLVLATALLHRGSRLVWAAAGALAASAAAGYVLSRTTGLPSASDDIGNWTEPLGLAALFVEGTVIALSGYAIAVGARARRPDQATVASERPGSLRTAA